MQEYIFEKLIIPFYLKYKKLNRLKYYNELIARDSLSQEELKKIQWRKLKALIYHCYENIPYYRDLFGVHGIHPNNIKNLEDYAKIPELTKQDIREKFDRLIDPYLPKPQIRYDSTGGSTGIPLQLARSQEDQEYGFALRYRSNAWCGWKFWEKSVWLVSDARRISDVNRLKGRLRAWILRRLLINTKNTTRDEMHKWVKQIKAFKPRHVYGYSGLLAEFARFVVDNNYKINGIEGVYSTSEELRHKELISQAFNAPVYDQYGASEIPCVAHECKKGNMHLSIDEVLVEFIDIDENSDVKKMILTPLYLYGMPLLRYEIQDAAIATPKECDCGLPYPVIELKIGRLSDNLVSPTGKIVSNVTFGWYFTDSTQGISHYQIIQESLNNFTVRIVGNEEFKVQNEQNIKELMIEMLNTSEVNVKFEYPDEILPGTNGKYRPIISKINDETSASQPTELL